MGTTPRQPALPNGIILARKRLDCNLINKLLHSMSPAAHFSLFITGGVGGIRVYN
uniref:Uncharacterized protein n=1 Tax=Rhizophora mucronata TaxID=61149 RepID=A0A2P2PYH9_RHIMU